MSHDEIVQTKLRVYSIHYKRKIIIKYLPIIKKHSCMYFLHLKMYICFFTKY